MDDNVKQLLKALEENDREKEMFLMRNKLPLEVRDSYGSALKSHINENYDITKPEDVKKLWKPNQAVETAKIVESAKLPKNALVTFNPANNTVKIPKGINAYDISEDIAHELGHAKNFGSNSEIDKQLQKLAIENDDELSKLVETPSKYNKLLGLSNAEKALNNHHFGSTFFEKGALGKLLKGGKLSLSALAPLAKATGIGAVGMAATGIGNKAMAGDFKGAALDTIDLGTDLTPILGEVKDAIRPTEIGNSELPPEEMEKRNKFNRAKAIEQLSQRRVENEQ